MTRRVRLARKFSLWCGVLLCTLAVAGCQGQPTATATAGAVTLPTLTQNAAYPAVTPTPVIQSSYPATTDATPTISAVAFVLDRPLKAGATVVAGKGTPGVVVSILNVTLFGTELGSGTIGPDGRFSITVAPLEANVRLGLMLKDVGSSGKQPDDFNADEYKGPGALMVPQVGYFLDTASVVP